MGSKGMAFPGLGAREEIIGQTQDDKKTECEVVEEEMSLRETDSQRIKF
jgi:hypothetical protein